MKRVVLFAYLCRMDELLQQSDEWRELVNPTDDSINWIQRLITTTCLIVNPWYHKQVKCRLVNVI